MLVPRLGIRGFLSAATPMLVALCSCEYLVFQSVLYGLKNSLKTVVVISPEFLLTTWNYCDLIIGELDAESLKNDLVSFRAIHI